MIIKSTPRPPSNRHLAEAKEHLEAAERTANAALAMLATPRQNVPQVQPDQTQ